MRSEKATNNSPAIGESIKMVANQLLQGSKTPPPTTGMGGIVADVRTPPRMKTQQTNKNKVIKPTSALLETEKIENSHAGVAIPMNPDDVEKTSAVSNKPTDSNKEDTSTPDGGLSTWILLSGNPTTPGSKVIAKKPEASSTTSKPKIEITTEKEIKKPQVNKNKTKTPTKPTRSPSIITMKPAFVRKPVAIGSSNKSDLIASGSAVNENTMNRIKASVLASVQKNKNDEMMKNAANANKTSTTSTTTTTTVKPTPKPTPKPTSTTTVKIQKVEVTTEKRIAPTKPSTTIAPAIIVKSEIKRLTKQPEVKIQAEIISKNTDIFDLNVDNNDLGIESKHAEIELEVSTPPPTTKKPKRTSNKRKKNKNRNRQPVSTTSKPEENLQESKVQATKIKTPTKAPAKDKPITTQIYNYLSREVMPTVGVGLMSLAGIVGIASYLFYPFGGVVRRAYDVNDRKDDLYNQNGELYADDGGQREEEILHSLFPDTTGKPNKNNNQVQPGKAYAGPTQFTYPQATPEQNIRYRNVAYGSDSNSFVSSDRVGQQNSEPIHGSAYSENIHYDTHSHDQNDRFSPYHQQLQPVYQSPDKQTENPGFLSEAIVQPYHSNLHGNQNDNQYGNQHGGPDSVYDYGQALRYSQDIITDTTSAPVQETLLHLGVEDVIEQQKETGYTVDGMGLDENKQTQFVVGNIPKELIEAVTPISVPEHGPRSLRRRKRNLSVILQEVGIQSAADSLKEILKTAHNEELIKNKDNAYEDQYFLPQNDFYTNIQAKSKYGKYNFGDEKRKNYYKKQPFSGNTDQEKIKIKIMSKKIKRDTSEENINAAEKINAGNTTEKLEKDSARVMPKTDEFVEDFENSISGNFNDRIPTIIYPVKEHAIFSPEENKNKLDVNNASQVDKKVNVDTNKLEPNTTKTSAKVTFIDLNQEQDDLFSKSNETQPITPKVTSTTEPPSIVVSNEPHPGSFSLFDFIKGLIDFKLRLGIRLLQTTSDNVAKYLKNVEHSFNYNSTIPVNSRFETYHKK